MLISNNGLTVTVRDKNSVKSADNYVYFDWNVFRFIMQPPSDSYWDKENIDGILFNIRKKYDIPLSHAHLRDRASRFTETSRETTKTDFLMLKTITESLFIGKGDNDSFLLVHQDGEKLFDNVLSAEKKVDVLSDKLPEFPAVFTVDMDSMNKKHPLYDILVENGGHMSPEIMDKFLVECYDSIFSDASLYRMLRQFVNQIKIGKNVMKQSEQGADKEWLKNFKEHTHPFIASLKYDVDNLKKQWKYIALKWFSWQNDMSKLSDKDMLCKSYCLLDCHPKFQDALRKNKNTLTNIAVDAEHAYWGTDSKYFVSRDKHMLAKIRFLYDAYGIKSKPIEMSDFLRQFC